VSPAFGCGDPAMLPSARRTFVPGRKELGVAQLPAFRRSLMPPMALPVSSLSLPTSSMPFSHFQGEPYLARTLPAMPPARRPGW
jgi:hypothetical protein